MKLFFLIAFLCFSAQGIGQTVRDSSHYIKLKASDNYNRPGLYTFFWGKHYRKEWNTPVTVKEVLLDTIHGGLIHYQTGGSRQTNSIRVRDQREHEWVFRSVDKTFGGALPKIAQGTFVERLADDQVTISHPYGALIVAPLAEVANIYHANPELLYVPKQPALGQYNDSAGDIMYTLEQRPDGDWSTAPNFGNAKKIVSTDKMLESILKDHDAVPDQRAFARARLFDMWIGDWGRHEDQWRWAEFRSRDNANPAMHVTQYKPVPRDRDNAFTKFDGFLLKLVISAAGAQHLQSFDYKLKKINRFNFPARNLDHHLLNNVSPDEWLAIANDLKARLTDDVIDRAVKQLPPEIYPISGLAIAAKLKARRELLPLWAKTYSEFLDKTVEITGSEKNERFEVIRLPSTTIVNEYRQGEGGREFSPFLAGRMFQNSQTKEIRIYGIGGNDSYSISGKQKKGIKIRLIGGTGKDTYTDSSSVRGFSHQTKIYDNPGNTILHATKETRVYTARDSAINKYDYSSFNYDKHGITPLLFYNLDDRIFLGMAYARARQKWRKPKFANRQYLDGKYSITQKAFSSTYYSNFLEAAGKWNLRNYANYDAVRWTNFFGLGNETLLQTKNRDFYRIRSEEFLARTGVDRVFQNKHRLALDIAYSTYHIISDTERYLIKASVNSPAMHGYEEFGLAAMTYVFQNINDSVLPVKGFGFYATASYSDNLQERNNNVGKYAAQANAYLPLTKKIGLVLRGGASTLSGDPQFYQYNSIGGTETLRGYQRNRFYGNSAVFSQNELRFITNFRSFLFNGKVGIFGLYDAGRVWLKGENSDRWHSGYGGGIIISPFNKLSISAAYAVSPEDANIHIKLMKPF